MEGNPLDLFSQFQRRQAGRVILQEAAQEHPRELRDPGRSHAGHSWLSHQGH